MRPLQIFIGYDEAEPVAFHACSESIIRNSSLPVAITPLYQKHLELKTPSGKENYPPSNGFIYTRFLVPELCSYNGLALFLDGDMIVTGDIADLFLINDRIKAVSVVKHPYYLPKHSIKYLGAVNEAYPRKNWSSVMMFDCSNYRNRILTRQFIESQTGSYLHRLEWLKDEEIGTISPDWNHLVGEDDQPEPANLYHYTNGLPCWDDWRKLGHADEYDKYHASMNYYKP